MKRDIRTRKKRFWVFALALVVALLQLAPVGVLAAEYTLTPDASDVLHFDREPELFAKDDVIHFERDDFVNDSVTIKYLDVNGDEIRSMTDNITGAPGSASFTVKDYNGTQIEPEAFKGWEKASIYGSSGYLINFTLKAVEYTKSDIIYVLNGGNNATGNPDSYYEGKEAVALLPATKTGYSFGGWYSDAQFTTAMTTIPTTQTGAVTLYAKFTPDTYNINYVLNGGTNASGNPTGYTFGTGVSSFADATKEGYVFDGWYSDAQFTTAVTTIPATQTGAVTLYAKFTLDTYNINYVLNGGTNASGNPTGYTFGTGVSSFADATKEGYVFDGWYSDAQFTTAVTTIPATQTGAVTLYAKFTQEPPETGDGTNLLMWALLAAVAGGLLTVSIRSRRRKRSII